MKMYACFAASVLLLGACQPFAADAPSLRPPPLPQNQNTNAAQSQSDADVTDVRLENGLRVLIQKDSRAPIVTTQIWYKVGASDEPLGKGGISHFLEHLMFKDTTLIGGEQRSRLIGYFGGEKNAFTSYDYTAYFESLPANQYPIALQIEADRMGNLLFNAQQIHTERQVVQEERRQRTDSNPIAKAYEAFRAFALPDSPKGRPVIGSKSDIDNLTQDDLQAWYTAWYQPQNAVLVLVGDVDPSEALVWIRRYFGDLKNAAPAPTRRLPTQPSHRGYQERTAYETVQTPMLFMGFVVPSLSVNAPDAYALSLVADIADGGLSARFEQNLVRDRKLFDNIALSYDPFGLGDDLLVVSATPKAGVDLKAAKDAILKELWGIATGDIDDAELQRGQNNLQASLIFANDSVDAKAQNLGALAALDLPLDSLQKLPKTLAQIDKTAIQNAAKKYLSADNASTLYVLPLPNDDASDADTKNP